MKNELIKIICFDLNETLIKENSWFNLNLAMGVTAKEDADIMKRYEKGELSYDQGQKLLLKLYLKRGKPSIKRIEQSLNKYTYKSGAKQIIKYLQKQGYIIVLISGSIDLLVKKIAEELDIKYYAANSMLKFDKKGSLKDIKSYGDEDKAKLSLLQSFCRRLKIKIIECACVGDGTNDELLFDKTKHGITFNGSKIQKVAWKTINKLADLRKIF